ncbi:MAG: hypothetical protein K8R60_09405 [Burkholderiales bacterium]|nr:hypothetical protein [Burkholderiales bacterium]
MILALAAGTCLAQGADPLTSPGCVQALDALEVREAAILSSGRAQGAARAGAAELAALQPYRKRVARECLGKEDLVLERPPLPPVVVAPVTLPPRAAPAVQGALPPRSPPVPLPPLRTVSQCDPSGCWTSDGLRLNRLGPLLVGPPGACTVQSGVLSCR